MNGCKRPHTTKPPLISPQTTPIAKPAITAIGAGTLAAIIVAESTADSAAVEPTDKSMPPQIITSVMPSATQALMEDC